MLFALKHTAGPAASQTGTPTDKIKGVAVTQISAVAPDSHIKGYNET